MTCPECGHSNLAGRCGDGEGGEYEEYECLDCGCQWNWKMQRTITVHRKEVDLITDKKKEVLIEVCGGMADCTGKPKGVKVIIVDHDNQKECDSYKPQVYEADEEIIEPF